MSKEAIERELINPILALMTTEKLYNPKTGKKDVKSPNRVAAEKIEGQFVILGADVIKNATSNSVNGAFDEKQLNNTVIEVYKIAAEEEANFKKKSKARWEQMNPARPPGPAYIVSQYEAVRRIKDKWYSYVNKEYFKITNKEAGKAAITTNVNNAHGDSGIALSGLVAARGLARLESLSNEASRQGQKEFISQLIEKANAIGASFTENVVIKYHHTQIATPEGEFRKDYNIILTLQSATDNNADSHIEKKILNSMRDLITAELLANMPGSASLKEAVQGVLINSVVTSAGKSFKTTTKNKSSYKSSTTGSKTKTVERKSLIPTTTLGSSRATVAKKRTAVVKPSFISLKALLEAKLPQEVKDRMSFPRLVNRTGRFASSVRVMSVDTTPSGAPSISYTYQKNPYDVFKYPSGRMGTPDRDPRSLIEGSIREIAMQAAIGRFYIRRV